MSPSELRKIAGYIKVSVRMMGSVSLPRDLPRVFERFFQVETHLTRRYGGMGLGLAVAKAMIELHGGRIWAESEEGRGSIFTFLLPIDQPQHSSPAPVHLWSNRKIRISFDWVTVVNGCRLFFYNLYRMNVGLPLFIYLCGTLIIT